MPCPYFEPRDIVRDGHLDSSSPSARPGRLPLIDEYDGQCHLRSDREQERDPRIRLLGCNQGNQPEVCTHLNRFQFEGGKAAAPARFSVQTRHADRLVLILVEEKNGRPERWRSTEFIPDSGGFRPEIESACQRAQLLAFCRSYLSRYPLSARLSAPASAGS